jgi:hypothetical protein
MEWTARSEALFGLCLMGKIDPHAIDPSILQYPYDDGINLLKRGADRVELQDTLSFLMVDAAEMSASQIKPREVKDFVELCKVSAVRYEVAELLEPHIKRWKRGEKSDVGRALEALRRLESNTKVLTPMSDITPLDVVWRPTFYPPQDEYFQGVPESSLIVVGGAPKTGKTTYATRLAMKCAINKKKVAFFSLEMTLPQLKYRMKQMDNRIGKSSLQNIYGDDGIWNVAELYAHICEFAANHPDLYLVVVDFADMIMPSNGWGHNKVAAVDDVYYTLAAAAKTTNVPIIVLSQLNDKYIGGRPRVNHLRGSRLIEALGAMVILLYNPNLLDVEQKAMALSADPGTGWIILGACRYGTGKGTLGAVQVPWDAEKGWGDRALNWVALAGG